MDKSRHFIPPCRSLRFTLGDALRSLLSLATPLLLFTLLSACSPEGKRHVIGVSQCSDDIWREKQNSELRMATYFQESVELRFAAAYDSDKRQIEQIDSLVASGIDLLIVAPNQIATISPAIDRAYDRGIPVIVFERKTNSRKYTAFMSADNYEMGRQMGQYIATHMQDRGTILEVMGLKGSSPAIERHKGFTDAVARYPDIHVVATLQGDWTEQSAYTATTQWLKDEKHRNLHVDYVFGHNDRMAMGVRRAFQALQRQSHGGQIVNSPLYCGIDGLPGKNGGIRLVRDSILDASYIYPTYGDRLLQLAINILDGKSYPKEMRMQSALVTHDNASVLLMQTDETLRQIEYLDQLHEKTDSYLQQLDTQRVISWLACGGIVLLLITFILFYLYYLGKVNIRRERVTNTLWNLKPEDVPCSEVYAPSSSESVDNTTPETSNEGLVTSVFITRFKEFVEARLSDSDLSIEDLAADMNLSRVQLYRKVKTITGSTPVELLRTARLNRGYQLLMTTDKSISEVAYEVGFTAPSYFTKCFKDEFGQLPGELRK